MSEISVAKSTVREYMDAFDRAEPGKILSATMEFMATDFHWRGMHPFYELNGIDRVVEIFWYPLASSMQHLQRREDIFFAGYNDADGRRSVWTCSMGHFMGLFNEDWIGIPRTGRIASLRYTEFMCVENGKITGGALFFDLIGLMHQAGVYPLPPMTGNWFIYPGPRTHDGVLLSCPEPAESERTMTVLNRMIADLSAINHLDGYECPPEILARTWHQDMVWYGPCGIGASYTIPGYQSQHQHPFRMNLANKTWHGHVVRIAEGNYAGFFGWANLSNRNTGGFMGLPAAGQAADMRVADVYRREGNKLAENWVIIDLPHYLDQQGLDVLERMERLGAI